MKYIILLLLFGLLNYSCNKEKIASRSKTLTQKDNVTFTKNCKTYLPPPPHTS